MKTIKTLGILAAGLLTLGVSLNASAYTDEQIGTVAGGLAGGLIGHQIGGGRGNTVATIGGTLAGAYIGGNVGRQRDARNYYNRRVAYRRGYAAGVHHRHAYHHRHHHYRHYRYY
jgi:uncharacterized protein YcfJ